MSDPVISPDGKSMWTGNEWIPLPPTSSNTNIQDSVIMGDLNTQIDHSVHNTFAQDTEKMVRNHLHIVADKMESSQFVEADEMYEKAKQIDYHLAENLYNEEFIPIFVEALWRELQSHHTMATNIIGDRISRILNFDENHIPSLLLLAETSLSRVNMASRVEKLKTAEYAYIKVLSIEPNNIQATKGIRTIKRMRRTDLLFALLGFSLVVGVAISLF